MDIMTSIKFATNRVNRRDAEGFPADVVYTWGESIPATVRDATSREAARAYQTGYEIDRIYVVKYYCGQNVIKDDADGAIYDIRRCQRLRGLKEFLLECKRREDGSGYPVEDV